METVIRNFAARIAIMTAAVMIAMFGMMAALVYLGAAIYFAYAQWLSAPLAALAAAGTAMFFSLLIVLIASLLTSRLKANRQKRKAFEQTTASAADLGETFGRHAFEFVQNNKKSALVGSLLAGFAFGASPRFRSFVRDIVIG